MTNIPKTCLSQANLNGQATEVNTMDFDDPDWQDGVIIGSFFDHMTEEEAEERRRRKLEKELFELDDPEMEYDEDDEY